MENTNTYKSDYGVELRNVDISDLPQLRRWRNQKEISSQMLSTDRISPKQQREWFESIQTRSDQKHWVLVCKGIRAGYVNIKGHEPIHLAGQLSVDAGLYLGNSDVRHPMLAVAAALAQLDYGFDVLKVQSVKTLVKADNSSALRLNQQLGYKIIDSGQPFVELQLLPEDYFSARERLRRFFR